MADINKATLYVLHNEDEKMTGKVTTDRGGKTRYGIVIAPDGQTTLECCDESERLRLRLTVSRDGHPSLLVFDEDGKVVHQAGRGTEALLKAGATKIPKIVQAVQAALKLAELAEPLL